MIIVIKRQRIRYIILVFVLLIAMGLFYLAARHEREQQTGAVGVVASAVERERVDEKSPQILLAQTSTGYFHEYRIERDKTRSMQIELLQVAAAEKDISEVRKAQLTAELMTLLKRSEREMQAESLLRAKGFSDAVVVLADNTASVVLPDVIDQTDAALVGELVARLAEVALERITIIDGAVDS